MAQSFHDLSLSERLALTRRGTALYSGQLSLIDNTDFDQPTLLPGWDCATLISHVAYNANALVNLVEWATTGVEKPMYPSPEARSEQIAYGATLIPDALRNLHDHTLIRLDVAWRDAPEDAWDHQVKTAQGRDVPMRETLWMRTREVWLHAIDLDVTAGFSDVPRIILETLLPEIMGKWAKAGAGLDLVLEDTDTGNRYACRDAGDRDTECSDAASGNPTTVVSNTTVVSGTTAGLVRWASGRGAQGVNDGAPEPPRWL